MLTIFHNSTAIKRSYLHNEICNLMGNNHLQYLFGFIGFLLTRTKKWKKIKNCISYESACYFNVVLNHICILATCCTLIFPCSNDILESCINIVSCNTLYSCVKPFFYFRCSYDIKRLVGIIICFLSIRDCKLWFLHVYWLISLFVFRLAE